MCINEIYIFRAKNVVIYNNLHVILFLFFCFRKHYNTGPVDLFFNGKPTPVKGLEIIFDSGSSYTYFNSPVYTIVANMVRQKLRNNVINFIFLFLPCYNQIYH